MTDTIYHSSRNDGITASSAEAILCALAGDGGLFTMDAIPKLPLDALAELPHDKLAARIIAALLPDFTEEELCALVREAYDGKFTTEPTTPTVAVGDKLMLELIHGPTSAFKDVALCLLPHLMRRAADKLGVSDDVLILTATSGDTGKAALEGFRDVDGTRIIVFFPDKGVSAVQRAQRVTQRGRNVAVCAVDGNFDDAQTGVKSVLERLGGKLRLSSANSINVGRLAAQVVYYFSAYFDAVKLGRIQLGDELCFCVPTGNFGNSLAGYLAGEMGLPVRRLICASNRNSVLTDFIRTGTYDARREFYRTESPSMDILISSNLERLLRLMSGDAALVASLMAQLRTERHYSVPDTLLDAVQRRFWAGCCDDEAARGTIRRVWEEQHYLSDTHTAVAWNVAEQYGWESGDHTPIVVLSTASPYKFPAAVLKALGAEAEGDEFDKMFALERLTGIAIPQNLRDLRQREIKHRSLVKSGEMLDYVLKKSEEKQW